MTRSIPILLPKRKAPRVLILREHQLRGENDGGPAGPGEEDNTMFYPGGFQLGILTFGLCMATFVVALDNTIIATAIPRITTVFDSLSI